MPRHLQFRALLITLLFLAGISLPLLNEYTGLISDLPSQENRALTPKPKMDIQLLDAFPQPYNKYYEDNFPFRFRMIQLHAQLYLNLYHTSPIPEQALIGDDGWLFMGAEDHDSWVGRHPLTDLEKSEGLREMEYRRQFLAKLGAKTYFMVVPTKNVIYADKMPPTELPLYDRSMGEGLTDYLRAHSQLRVVDIFAPLKAAQDGRQLYYPHDNHWNGRGATIGAAEFLREVHKDFPNVPEFNPADWEIARGTRDYGNLSSMFGTKVPTADSTYQYTPKGGFKATPVGKVPYQPVLGFAYPDDFERERQHPDTTRPKLLIIGDSFTHDFYEVVAEHFGRTVRIFDAWQYKLNEGIVMNEKPDVVLFMMSEALIRHIGQFPASPHKIDPLGPIPAGTFEGK